MKIKADQKQNKQKKVLNKKNINYNNNITDLVEINDKEIKYNTPLRIIIFNNKFYNITTRNYLDKNEATWKCINNRRTKDKPDNYKNFCNGTIKGFRDLFSKKYIIFI